MRSAHRRCMGKPLSSSLLQILLWLSGRLHQALPTPRHDSLSTPRAAVPWPGSRDSEIKRCCLTSSLLQQKKQSPHPSFSHLLQDLLCVLCSIVTWSPVHLCSHPLGLVCPPSLRLVVVGHIGGWPLQPWDPDFDLRSRTVSPQPTPPVPS